MCKLKTSKSKQMKVSMEAKIAKKLNRAYITYFLQIKKPVIV